MPTDQPLTGPGTAPPQMVDEEDKKDEGKVEFDSAGEPIGYISLDQAQVLALRAARDDTRSLPKT